MDAAAIFRRGLGSVSRAREAKSQIARTRESSDENEDHAPRIAHTLTACCRCRSRKTRCDPNLPRCMPCERVGAQCEYFDTAKDKKISRMYVIRLQDRVRELEAELSQYTEEDETNPEQMLLLGGLTRLDENDETPRFLGPSSGIAMTRIVMEEAKRYTDSRHIRELVPEVGDRKTPVQSPGDGSQRKKSYPMISAVAAQTLPRRDLTDKLVEVFNQRSQFLTPTLHEPTLLKDVDDVYSGSKDPYKNFITSMVIAISMQKLDTQYAGLADSYYLAALLYLEEVIRPKDIKSLQCLILVSNYSLLTPTRTAIYYVVGLATRICEQLGFTEEKTIVQSLGDLDPLQLDMRRRLSWIVLTMEYGLAHSLGRPNAFATGKDHIDVQFFSNVDDQYITPGGIVPGAPPSDKKIVAIHFIKMRLLQAEIRRTLYEMRRPEPNDDGHPWFQQMVQEMETWRDSAPPELKPWFEGRYDTMIVFLFRPSPQVPKPSEQAAIKCYDACAHTLRYQRDGMRNNTTEVTWIFVQTIFMALNTLLWSISHAGVRSMHSKSEVEEVIRISLDMIGDCSARWPGSDVVSRHYSTLAHACLRSYDVSHPPSSLSANSPASLIDASSPSSEHSSAITGSPAYSHNAPEAPPIFGNVWDTAPNQFSSPEYVHRQLTQPAFRSGSIFAMPSTSQTERRFSAFPPEVSQSGLPSPAVSWQTMPLNPSPNAPANYAQPPRTQGIQPPPGLVTDPGLFMQSPNFGFGPHLYDGTMDFHGRQGSLSQQQQVELMEFLETEGMNEIGNLLNMNPVGEQMYYGMSF